MENPSWNERSAGALENLFPCSRKLYVEKVFLFYYLVSFFLFFSLVMSPVCFVRPSVRRCRWEIMLCFAGGVLLYESKGKRKRKKGGGGSEGARELLTDITR